MPPKKKQKRKIESYSHEKKQRKNNPPVGLAKADPSTDEKQTYHYDPHLPPELQWAGKAEHTSFDVPTLSLHVHERIDPCTIIEAVRKRNGGNGKQISMFDNEANMPSRHAIEFYKHDLGWSNRLIAGDSLLIMNSLLQKENMAGKVQCVYIDPPYGIKYGSNFQPHVNKRNVKDGKDEDLSTEPETIRAFRDTWELGVHSYLSYIRDRLLLAKELLNDSGSCFVQISDENVHHVREIMDEVFGVKNFVAQISFRTKNRPMNPKHLEQMCDFAVWYAKNKKQVKYRKLYIKKNIEGNSLWKYIGFPDGTYRQISPEEINNHALLKEDFEKGGKIFQSVNIEPVGKNETRIYEVEFNNKKYKPSSSWKYDKETMNNIKRKNLLILEGNTLRGKYFFDFYPVQALTIPWNDTNLGNIKNYVVQTAVKVIERCILMTTDPGDLVLDPTCGSGTTAYVAEKWGRRWITCDTSRVATTLAKQRLMTTTFDYYKLAYPEEGINSGFEYKKVPHITLKSIADDEPPVTETLYDKPLPDDKKARVTGPFTVEAVPSPTVQPIGDMLETAPIQADETVVRSGATLRYQEWCNGLLKAGIRGKSGQRISFSRIEPLPCRWLHADAETKPDDSGEDIREVKTAYHSARAVISFGPEHGLLDAHQVKRAIEEAGDLKPKPPQIIVFAAFQFDPEAAKDIDKDNWPGVKLLKVQMNADLQVEDLKKNDRASDSFWLIGQPEIEIKQIEEGDLKGQWQVQVKGFDYFDTKTGKLKSGNESNIAVWMLDTDYDGKSLYPKQIFFPMAGDKGGWTKLAKSLKAEIDEELIESYKGTISLPFELGKEERIAVKIVDDRGIESLIVRDVTPENTK